MLIINEHDIDKIVEPNELISAIEKAYRIQDYKSTLIVGQMHLCNQGNGIFIMPGFIKSIFGTNVFLYIIAK